MYGPEAYPSGISDDERAFVAPYVSLMTEGAPQRTQPLREIFNGLRWIARASVQTTSGSGIRHRLTDRKPKPRPALRCEYGEVTCGRGNGSIALHAHGSSTHAACDAGPPALGGECPNRVEVQ